MMRVVKPSEVRTGDLVRIIDYRAGDGYQVTYTRVQAAYTSTVGANRSIYTSFGTFYVNDTFEGFTIQLIERNP